MMYHTLNKRLQWQHLIKMVIYKICKMTIEDEKQSQKVSFQYLMVFWSSPIEIVHYVRAITSALLH